MIYSLTLLHPLSFLMCTVSCDIAYCSPNFQLSIVEGRLYREVLVWTLHLHGPALLLLQALSSLSGGCAQLVKHHVVC
jgi:hypothetical protein